MKKRKGKVFCFWILLSEAVGALSGWLSREGIDIYSASIEKPPLSPPQWLFPIVWGILFALMGISAAKVSLAPASPARSRGLNLFSAQLIVNFFWPLFFFNAQAFGFAFVWLIILWCMVFVLIWIFWKADKCAAWLLVPYLIWLTFAAYLNAAVWVINSR